jgi:crotonobetainyl-CoA:carnitine CoA-transferase CaiB-like acyl-CoA transferase
MGADVLKIEDKQGGDYARQFFLSKEDTEHNEPSVFYRAINHNKRNIKLNLKDKLDKEAFLELIRGADLVIESFRPTVMDKLGLGHEVLLSLKPSLVYCAITGYGMYGPFKDMACHDINSLALTGVLDQFRDFDARPILPNLQIADLLGGGVCAAMGCLAALWRAKSSGLGGVVDVSMTDGVLAHNLTAQVAVHSRGRTLMPFEDLLNGGVPCYNLYSSADGAWFALGALELKFWQNFCIAVNKPEWSDKHWSLGQEVGGKDSLELRDQIQRLIGSKEKSHWLTLFRSADCCMTPVLSLAESMQLPLFKERNMFTLDEQGKSWIKSPIKFS